MFPIMETLPSPGVALVSVIAFMCLIRSKTAKSKVPQSVPWAGIREEVLSETRVCIREFKAGLRTLKSGCDQVSNPFSPTLALLKPCVCTSVESVYLL